MNGTVELSGLFFPIFTACALLSCCVQVGKPLFAKLLIGAAAWCVALFVMYPLHYFWYPGFYDHVEPAAVQISMLLGRGVPLYHEVDAAYRYSLLYGPNTYLAIRLSQTILGETFFAAKLPGVLLALGSLGFTTLALTATARKRESLCLGLIYFCGMAMVFRHPVFWARPDPLALFLSSLALFGTTRRNPILAFAILGAAFGACINVKATLPLAGSLLLPMILPRLSLRSAGAFVVAAVTLLALPYLLFPEISLSMHLAWLRMAARHGFAGTEASHVIVMLGFLLLPVAMEGAKSLASWPGTERHTFWRRNGLALALALIGTCVLALVSSKHGAGEWHLMPLLPILAYYLARAHDRLKAGERQPAASFDVFQTAFVSFACVAVSIVTIVAMSRVLSRSNDVYRKAEEELSELGARYDRDQIAMGYGADGGHARLTWLRPLLHSRANLLVDEAALMDMKASGLAIPESTLDVLRHGDVKVWTIPRDEKPFTITSYYDKKPLFSDKFREVFLENYRRTEQLQSFDLWTHRASPLKRSEE